MLSQTLFFSSFYPRLLKTWHFFCEHFIILQIREFSWAKTGFRPQMLNSFSCPNSRTATEFHFKNLKIPTFSTLKIYLRLPQTFLLVHFETEAAVLVTVVVPERLWHGPHVAGSPQWRRRWPGRSRHDCYQPKLKQTKTYTQVQHNSVSRIKFVHKNKLTVKLYVGDYFLNWFLFVGLSGNKIEKINFLVWVPFI